MLKIIYNNEITKEKQEQILQAIKDNQGYCPCKLEKTDETRCMCREFKNLAIEGTCFCQLFKKIKEN